MKPAGILFSLMCLFVAFNSNGQSIYFTTQNGSVAEYGLDDVKNITFQDSILNLNMTNGITYSWDINELQKFEYSNFVNSIMSFDSRSTNLIKSIAPSHNNGTFRMYLEDNHHDNMNVNLFSTSGQLLESIFYKNIQDDDFVDVAFYNLTRGHYLLYVESDNQFDIKSFSVK